VLPINRKVSPDHRKLEEIQPIAIGRVRENETPAGVITSYGFNLTTIYKCKWSNAAAKDGDEELRSAPATGRP
jgi:hypothetical protein